MMAGGGWDWMNTPLSGTVYTNDRKKCVYSKKKVWISDSEERGLIISFLYHFFLEVKVELY